MDESIEQWQHAVAQCRLVLANVWVASGRLPAKANRFI